MDRSTIVALSSGALPSGVAVIRLSGSRAVAAAQRMSGALEAPRRLALRTLVHPDTGQRLDQGLVVHFPAPHSFTGEDCVELQVHGSPAGVKAILDALVAIDGVRLAQAGEFTRRAFENGKLDLTAIEGLGDLLAAETENQRRQALARLEGGLAGKIVAWRETLLDLRAEIEARLDFSDEDDVPFALPEDFSDSIAALSAALSDAASGYDTGRIRREGLRVVLAGAPNAGKSSLLNALAGSDLAIVSDVAGTTRDTKDVHIDIGGQLVTLIDTAGLRATDDKIELEGIRRANAALAGADIVLWLIAPDSETAALPDLPPGVPVWRIATKSDLGRMEASCDLEVSTKIADGVDPLISRLKSHIEGSLSSGEAGLVSHLRDKMALDAGAMATARALETIDRPEICADFLRMAADEMARLTGLMDSEAVLDRLFAGFCIGK